MLIAAVVAFGFGFGLGRVHHISSLKAKIAKLGATLKTDEAAVVEKVKALVKF